MAIGGAARDAESGNRKRELPVTLLAGAEDCQMKATPAGVLHEAKRATDRVETPMTRGLGLGSFIHQLVHQAKKDHLTAYAGNLAFRGFFAIFATLIVVLWLLQVTRTTERIDAVFEVAATVLPETAIDTLRHDATAPARERVDSAFTFTAVVAMVVAFIAISGTMRATMEALNAMYAVEEARSSGRRLLISGSLSFAVNGLLLAALVMVVFGAELANRLAGAAGWGIGFEVVWTLVSWPVLFVAVMAAFALVYYFGPDVEQRCRWISGGTAAAVVLWLIFTALFSLFVNNFNLFTQLYGALAGIVLLMIYLFASAFILLLGAEINQVIEMRHPDGKNEGEKELDGEKVNPGSVVAMEA